MTILTSSTLKIIAMVLMALDHVYTYIGLNTGIDIPIWFGYLGKLSAPIFFYLIVEGFYHTKSRKNYLSRLFSMAIIMTVVDLVFEIQNNIFFSLGFGFMMMCFMERAKQSEKKDKYWFINLGGAILCGMIITFFTEGSIFALGMILIFYIFRNRKVMMSLAYIVFSLFGLISSVGSGFLESAFIFDYQWMMVFAILPIWLYNGKLGISNKHMKWFFYWFYPIHLMIIVSLSNVISTTNPASPLKVNENLLQEIVHQIDADISYKTNTKFEVQLSSSEGTFESIYLIELYEEATRMEVASGVIPVEKPKTSIKTSFKVLPSAKLSRDKAYILTVYDLGAETLLFEDVVSFN